MLQTVPGRSGRSIRLEGDAVNQPRLRIVGRSPRGGKPGLGRSNLPGMRVIGLMSGTSADGVDAALVEWPDDEAARPFRLVATASEPFSASLQKRVHTLAAGRLAGADVLSELASLDVELADRFASVAREAARIAGMSLSDVDAIASHGQTVGHFPERSATIQIGDPSRIAELTGCTVVADFRARDMAAGGEGAPLAPFFHWSCLADPTEHRVALNLGGISNVTWLPEGGAPDDVIAFDVGPANSLVDGVVQIVSEGRQSMDEDGAAARRGSVRRDWLDELLDDPYLRKAPPKSTGRERYGTAESEAWVERARAEAASLDDLVATLTAFTVEAITRACRDFLPATPSRVLVGGGGAANPVMMESLSRAVPGAHVEPFDAAGVPRQAAEAMAFSLMGRNTLLGLPNHLPRCTGAKRACVLGEIVDGRRT